MDGHRVPSNTSEETTTAMVVFSCSLSSDYNCYRQGYPIKEEMRPHPPVRVLRFGIVARLIHAGKGNALVRLVA